MQWLSFSLLSAFFKSLSTITEKEILFKEKVVNYTSGILFIISIFSLPLLFFVKKMDLSLSTLYVIFALSLLGMINTLLFTYILKKIDIGESSVIFATTPIIVAIMGIIFIGESLSSIQTLGIIISSLGLFILEFPEKEKHSKVVESGKNSRKKIYFIIIMALVFYGFGAIGDRYAVHYLDTDPILYLLIGQLCTSLFMFAYEILKRFFSRSVKENLIDEKLLLSKVFWLNVVLVILSRLTYILSVGLVSIGLSNAVRQSNVLITTAVGGKLFKEKSVLRRSLAGLVVVLGVVLVVV